MGDTYSNLNIGHYNREALASIDNIVNSMLVTTIAEPIECVDASDSYGKACDTMREKRFDVLGVRSEGCVVGYVPLAQITREPDVSCLAVMNESADDFRRSVVKSSFKLFDALQELGQQQRLFVSDKKTDEVVGIVTRADLQKAPIRMMIFAYITVLEIHLTAMIRERYPQDGWMTGVTPRIRISDHEKVDREERVAAGEDTDLLCIGVHALGSSGK